jgi:Protein of unknown function (DUF3662)/FHA domain
MLARFERMMEQAVEGSLRRVFPTRLQPVQLAKAAARAMEEAQVVGLRGTEVPNAYTLRVSPEDLARFGEYSATLADQVAEYLADYARQRGLRPVGPPRVEVCADGTVRPGTVRGDARFVDLEPRRQAALEEALEGTRQLRLALPEQSLRLTDRFGLDYLLEPETGLVRVGRAADNDVAIPDQRVSRYHAQLRWGQGGWLVSDLDSTNGTFVDDERVAPAEPRPLGAGSVLRLADHDLSIQSC